MSRPDCRRRRQGTPDVRSRRRPMDFDQYVAARYGRLVEHAVLLGCAEGEAGTYVDQVLLRAAQGDPPGRGPRPAGPRGAGARDRRRPERPPPGRALVAVGAGGGGGRRRGAVTYRPPPEPLPSLFALNGDQAESSSSARATTCAAAGPLLRATRTRGRLRPAQRWAVRQGATVTVRTSVLRAASASTTSRDGWPPGSSFSMHWAEARARVREPVAWWSTTVRPCA